MHKPHCRFMLDALSLFQFAAVLLGMQGTRTVEVLPTLCANFTCKPPRFGVLSTAGGALAGRTSCRLRCSRVIVKMAWLRLDLHAARPRHTTPAAHHVMSLHQGTAVLLVGCSPATMPATC